MKATFVNFSQNFFDKLSVYPLAAQLKKHAIGLDYININNFRKAIRYLEKTCPHIVLYSAFSKDISIYVRFDKILKETLPYQIKSIIGGAGQPMIQSCWQRVLLISYVWEKQNMPFRRF